MSTDLIEKVDSILEKVKLPERHSFFQIEKFMVGKEPTAQSQLWAIVRELEARRDTMEAYKKDLADAEDSIELFDIKMERISRAIREEAKNEGIYTDLNIQENEINIRKLQRDKDALIKAARKVNEKLKYLMEEMAYLLTGYEKIVSKFGEMKPFDDEQSQREMWNEKLLEEFNLRVIFQRPFDPEFVRTVMCLHDEAPVKKNVVSLIDNIQKKMIADRSSEAKKPSISLVPKITGR